MPTRIATAADCSTDPLQEDLQIPGVANASQTVQQLCEPEQRTKMVGRRLASPDSVRVSLTSPLSEVYGQPPYKTTASAVSQLVSIKTAEAVGALWRSFYTQLKQGVNEKV